MIICNDIFMKDSKDNIVHEYKLKSNRRISDLEVKWRQ